MAVSLRRRAGGQPPPFTAPPDHARQGLYKYVDMDVASETGSSMADHILSGRTKQEAIGGIPYEDRVFA